MKEKIINSSLASKIRYSYLLLIVPSILFLVFAIVSTYYMNLKYNDMIKSATTASKFSLEFKDDFDYKTYLLIVGNQTIEETQLYEMIDQAYEIAENLEEITITSDSEQRLVAAKKYLDNLRKYIGRIEENLTLEDRYEENIEIWENDVQIVTTLLSDSINEYLFLEIQNIQRLQEESQKSYMLMVNGVIGGLLVLTLVMIILSYFISESIASPIRQLNKVTEQVAKGDLSVRANIKQGTEVKELGNSLNEMIEKIETLLENVKADQTYLREAELELLQSQINPHFLYNTLDTIVWLAEGGDQKQVVEMVESLSDFFRISLNKGKELITLEEEIKHVTSYLEIQQIRYRDILSYEIQMDETCKNYLIPKITLQPLVENALYHGIKNKRGMGKIIILIEKQSNKNAQKIIEEENSRNDNLVEVVGDSYQIKIIDNGIGMTQAQLKEVDATIHNSDTENRKSFGLFNVNERIRLKFGEIYGLSFESTYKEGTTATLVLPCYKG